jgi:radical SAM superfamily enzyme YgiQ (UPF0313 family)
MKSDPTVVCIYTTDNYLSVKKPLYNLMDVHLGLGYVATALKGAGFDTRILVFTPQSKVEKSLVACIQNLRPMFFCLTAATTQYPFVLNVAETIRRINPDIPILLGGHHASLNPEEALNEECFDAVCVGEGEFAAVEFAEHIHENQDLPDHIPSIWTKHKQTGKIMRNECRPFQKDLDQFPFLDIGMWEEWVADLGHWVNVLVGRGCPYRCAYCSNHALARLASGKYVRFRSPESIIKEIKHITTIYPSITNIYLRAETLSVDKDYTFSLCDHLIGLNSRLKNPLEYMTSLSLKKELIENDVFLSKLKAAGVGNVSVGLESGSERIRSEILRRPPYSNLDIIKFSRMARKLGIKVSLNNLIGLPGETLSDFKRTIECVRVCNPDHAHLYVFYPYPGTDLFERSKQMGLPVENAAKTVTERRIARFSLPGFSRMQIQREYLLFWYKVFKGKMPLYKIIGRIMRELIFLNPRINALFRSIVNRKGLKTIIQVVATDPKRIEAGGKSAEKIPHR